jgi:hypothetical protein
MAGPVKEKRPLDWRDELKVSAFVLLVFLAGLGVGALLKRVLG